MTEQRRAQWISVIRKSRRGEPVSPEEHDALLRAGLFQGIDRIAAEEEAHYVVRYLLSGEDLSDIAPRGSREAENWFAMRAEWGAELQTLKLHNMIAASEYDSEYRVALNHVAIRFQEKRLCWPAMLADWDIAVRQGTWREPARLRGNQGQPHYAQDSRNVWLAYSSSVLVQMGLGRMAGYDVIADELDKGTTTVRDAVRSTKAGSGRIPAPWECWPAARQSLGH